jgi:hypothetical protein
MMKHETMNHLSLLHKRNLGIALLAIAIGLSSACGNKLIRGASPIVRMTELSHQQGRISLQVTIRNLNGVDLDVLGADLRLLVENRELLSYRGPVNVNIVANGTETWSVEVEESAAGMQLLDQLEKGEVKSLPYSLTGSITSREDGLMRVEYEGHIYPLPGKPGHFR